MTMVDRGEGSPIVLIPGLQGRWEWMAPAVDAISAHHRVLSFSLGDVKDARVPERAFDAWVEHIDALLDRAGETHATIVGVSFGGLVALYYAAERRDRTSALVLVSTPAPKWRWDHPSAGHVRHPRLSLPIFAVRAVGRLLPEMRALEGAARPKFLTEHIGRAIRFPASPTRMAGFVRAWDATDLIAACDRITAPTLVITGDPDLDRVVPVDDTMQYVSRIRGARHARLARTGHLGVISRPRRLADMIAQFIDGAPWTPDSGRRATMAL
jgi:3-oxoadipate enol-lactonase